MSETRDQVSVHIDNILLELPSSPTNPTIFRVDDDLRHGNENLYDPKILSIGPFHHRTDHLQKLQRHKLLYLKCSMKRRKESTVDKYVIALRSLEHKARTCYSGPIELNPDEFVEMLLLDGFFIVELIRKYSFDNLREKNDTIFEYEQILSQLRHDLMLVENQIPFFILDQLFAMTKSGNPYDEISYLVRLFIDDISPWPEPMGFLVKISTKNTDHLLGLVYKIWCSSFAEMTANRPIKTKEEKITAVNSATELQESGVKFKKCAESNCFDIGFDKGVMRIPGFSVSDETESIFRNLIAYEHSFFIDNHPKYVTDYAFFLHCLVNSSKDVEILRRSGIVTNLLGDDEMVYHMFNRLGRNILVSPDFCYADVYDGVKGHCGRRRNRWMAILRRDYFNSPWSLLKFVAALLVLLFTFTQTLFGVLSYVNPK